MSIHRVVSLCFWLCVWLSAPVNASDVVKGKTTLKNAVRVTVLAPRVPPVAIRWAEAPLGCVFLPESFGHEGLNTGNATTHERRCRVQTVGAWRQLTYHWP